VNTLMILAQNTGGRVLVGIPSAASTTEFETADCGGLVSSGYQQEEYVARAAQVLAAHHCKPEFLGASLWAFTASANYAGCAFTPAAIQPEVWDVLKTYSTPACSGPTPTLETLQDEPLVIKAFQAAPNPAAGPLAFYFESNDDMTSAVIEIYSMGLTKLLEIEVPAALLAGRKMHSLPLDPAGAWANGLYHVILRADRADGSRASKKAIFMIAR
jgi:hypothetical protein